MSESQISKRLYATGIVVSVLGLFLLFAQTGEFMRVSQDRSADILQQLQAIERLQQQSVDLAILGRVPAQQEGPGVTPRKQPAANTAPSDAQVDSPPSVATTSPVMEAPERDTGADKALQALDALESRLGKLASAPVGVSDAEGLRNELNALLASLPLSLEPALLPRINIARWNVYALELVARAQSTRADQAGELLADIDVLAATNPQGVSEQIQRDLSDARATLLKSDDEYRWQQIQTIANTLINDGGPQTEYEDALARLDEWQHNKSTEAKATQLRLDLELRLVLDGASGMLKSIDKRIQYALREPTYTTRQVALGHALDAVVRERQGLLSLEAKSPAQRQRLSKLVEELGEKARWVEGNLIRVSTMRQAAYQSWALRQIQDFNGKLATAQGGTLDKALHKSNYLAIRDAFIAHLVPVTVSALEPAVAKLYGEAFEKGWNALEDKKDLQTEVALSETKIVKKLP